MEQGAVSDTGVICVPFFGARIAPFCFVKEAPASNIQYFTKGRCHMSNLQALIMNVTSAIPTPIVAAEGSSYWQSVSQSIANAIDSALPYVWILVSLAIIGVGLLCIIGSDRSKEVAKSKFVYICVGAALVLAAAYIGKGITSALNGAGDWSSVVS